MSVVLCLPAHLRVSTAASRGQAPHRNASVSESLTASHNTFQLFIPRKSNGGSGCYYGNHYDSFFGIWANGYGSIDCRVALTQPIGGWGLDENVCSVHARIVHAAGPALCKLHALTVHTARMHCARCTPALCTLHARIVHTARTHCAHCTHALCTRHARIVHAARTHCGHCTHALCTLHARTVHSAFDALWIAILGFMTLVLLADREREPLLEHVE